MDPGTPIVVDKKNTSPARQLWKKQYVYADFFYLVSKLGDNIKLGFRVKFIIINLILILMNVLLVYCRIIEQSQGVMELFFGKIHSAVTGKKPSMQKILRQFLMSFIMILLLEPRSYIIS